ncbi:MAG: hypothetical protein WCA77_05530, partial [Thermoplasmata archaeon]
MFQNQRKLAPICATLTTLLMVVAGTVAVVDSSAVPQVGTNLGLTQGTLDTSGVNPVIVNVVNFTITSTSSGSSGTFSVASGDALVVFVEMYGATTVTEVASSEGSGTCTQESYALQHANGGDHGFAIWVCRNVESGSATNVSVTLSSGSSDSAAVEIVDVNGGTTAPFVDQVGVIDHSDSRAVSRNLTVNADDLVLAGIGTWSQNTITPASGVQLLGEITSRPIDSAASVTAGALAHEDRSSTPVNIWMNATLAKSAPALEGIITLGAANKMTPYPVTFSETGLPYG